MHQRERPLLGALPLRTRRFRVGLGALCTGLLALLPACQDVTLPELGPNTPRHGEETLKIGLVTVLGEGFGDSPRLDAQAVDLAVSQVNAAGGILGRNVEVVIGDFGGDDNLVKPVTRELIDQGVVGLLATETSGWTLDIAEVARDYNLPQISCCGTSTDLTGAASTEFLFRTIPSDAFQARAVAQVAQSDDVPAGDPSGIKRGAIIYVDDVYGQTFRDNLEASFAGAEGIEILDSIPVAEFPAASEYPGIIQRLQAAREEAGTLDFVALVAFEDAGGEIINAWYRTVQQPLSFLTTDGVYTNRFVEVVAAGSPEAFDRMVGTAPAPIPDSPAYRFLQKTYTSTYGEEPIAYAAHQYDAAMLLMLAIQVAGSTDGVAIRDALYRVSRRDTGSDLRFRPDQIALALKAAAEGKEIDYDGASGAVDFDDNGDVGGTYAVWQVVDEGGSYVFENRSYVDTSVLGQ